MKTIKLLDFWTSLISRSTAKQVFKIAEINNFEVTFNLKWVDFISTSFSDEHFANWKQDIWQSFKISNMKNELMKLSIKQALITREKFTCA
jgi:hypothetical protein